MTYKIRQSRYTECHDIQSRFTEYRNVPKLLHGMSHEKSRHETHSIESRDMKRHDVITLTLLLPFSAMTL